MKDDNHALLPDKQRGLFLKGTTYELSSKTGKKKKKDRQKSL